MNKWGAVLNPWTASSPAQRWALLLALTAGVWLMTFYTQLLNEHMVHADKQRLGQRAVPGALAAAAVPLPPLARPRRRPVSDATPSTRK
jgi:hypothetical protein